MKLKDLNGLYWKRRELSGGRTDKSREKRLRDDIKAAERFINGIQEPLTRQVFRYRFEDNMSWTAVAARIGGGNTADGVKKICYRYLRRSEECRRNR